MQFGLIEMWTAMGGLAKSVAIILVFLSILSIYLFFERNIVFARARGKSKQIAPKLANLLKSGKVEEALNLSSKKEFKGSHLARVTASGIQEFFEGKKANLQIEDQISTASRGMDRASNIFTQELKEV